MSMGDRAGVAVQGISQDDKLSRTSSVLADGVVENVSQVWQVGPLAVWLEERDGVEWLVVEGSGVGAWRRGVAAELEVSGVGVSVLPGGSVGVDVRLTPALDRFLVELVDVIADVRRATGMVQLELEGLEEGDVGDVASGGVER